jgi:hypothetical protein
MTKHGKQEIINISGRDQMTLLNELGAEDWELVTGNYQRLYLKRELSK